MNIFILDTDPVKCAKYHNDVHLNKMLLEATQLLCNVHHHCGTHVIPYKKTHVNHPCSVWTRTSISNYNWLLRLAFELENERIFRGFKRSKCLKTLMWLRLNTPSIPEIGLTPFAIATYKGQNVEDPVQAYREYYISHKQGMYVKQRKLSTETEKVSKFRRYKWTRTGIPEWYVTNHAISSIKITQIKAKRK